MPCHLPSLQTVACGFREAFSAFTASPALVVSYLQQTSGLAQLHGHELTVFGACHVLVCHCSRVMRRPIAAHDIHSNPRS